MCVRNHAVFQRAAKRWIKAGQCDCWPIDPSWKLTVQFLAWSQWKSLFVLIPIVKNGAILCLKAFEAFSNLRLLSPRQAMCDFFFFSLLLFFALLWLFVLMWSSFPKHSVAVFEQKLLFFFQCLATRVYSTLPAYLSNFLAVHLPHLVLSVLSVYVWFSGQKCSRIASTTAGNAVGGAEDG